MGKVILTIERQYGSGGKEIGEKLSKALGIPVYDKELLTIAAKKSGISEEILDTLDEKPTNSLLYSLVMGSKRFLHSLFYLPESSRLFSVSHWE